LKALQAVKDLEDKLLSLEQVDIGELKARNGGREIRIWMDGAFDMMHYGKWRVSYFL
jgi:ethanolamine-phosphate cytidylyltransferase